MIEADEIVTSRFRRLMELRTRRDQDKSALEESERAYREYEAELYDELEASPVRGVRRIDVGEPWGVVTFTPKETIFGRILDEDAAVRFFAGRDMEASHTRRSITKRKLNELVREYKEQGRPMPPGIDWTPNRGISISVKRG